MAVIALYNIKGGVGKTAGTVNLAYCAAQQGKKTLIIDLDPQSASSYYFKVKPKKKYNEQRLLDGGTGVDKNIRGTDYENLDLLPADFSYRNLDLSIDDRKKSQNRLRKVISPLRKQYEHIFIDCPPSLSLLTLNALTASDSVLIPIQCEYYALEGLSQLLNTINLVQQKTNAGLDIEGVLLTMYDNRLNLCNQVAAEVRDFFKDKVYKTVVNSVSYTHL